MRFLSSHTHSFVTVFVFSHLSLQLAGWYCDYQAQPAPLGVQALSQCPSPLGLARAAVAVSADACSSTRPDADCRQLNHLLELDLRGANFLTVPSA